jgi:hypothetical protein
LGSIKGETHLAKLSIDPRDNGMLEDPEKRWKDEEHLEL